MSVAGGQNFWEVQSIWARVKNSPVALGGTENTRTAACCPAVSSSDEDLGEKLLKLLAFRGSLDSYELSQELGVDHQQVVGAIKSVQSLGEVTKYVYPNNAHLAVVDV